MSIQSLLPELVHSNPWQTRLAVSTAHVEALAAEYRAGRHLPLPLARPHPEIPDAVQLAHGHNRRAAWALAFPGMPLDVQVEEIADRDMAEIAMEENAKRQDLNPIEKARALQRYMADFGATQAVAGAHLGLEQSSVANLVGLLDFPAPIQDLAASGALPLRLAWKLKKASKLWPDRACNAAAVIALQNDDEREREARDQLNQMEQQLSAPLDFRYWKEDWVPDATISAEMFRSEVGEPKDPPACKGCAYRFERKMSWSDNTESRCGRRACLALKQRIWGTLQAAKAAPKLHLPLAGADEKVAPFYDGELDYSDKELVTKLLKSGLPCLRVLPRETPDTNYGSNVYGSPWVRLGTTDPKAVDSFLHGGPMPDETPAQREKRIAKEKAEREERAEDRSEFHRARADCQWLLIQAASALAPQLQIAGPILEECEEELTGRDHIDHATGLTLLEDDLEKRIDERVKQGQAAAADLLRRAHILFNIFVDKTFSTYSGSGKIVDFQAKNYIVADVIAGIEERAEDLDLKLPNGWKNLPVHHTPLNCWECGRFGTNAKGITATELKAGWLVEGKADAPTAVYCPECAAAKKSERETSQDFPTAAKKAVKRLAKRTKGKGVPAVAAE